MNAKRTFLGVGLATLALTGVGIADTESSIRFEVIDLGSLGWTSYPASVNSRGEVVGDSHINSDPDPIIHAFLWTRQLGMIDLGTLGGSELSSFAQGMNDAVPLPQVVGYSYVTTALTHAFLWENGTMTDLGTPGVPSDAHAINNRGQVVGSSGIPEKPGESHAVLWEGGTMVDLGTLGGRFSLAYDINDAGQVVGYSTVDPYDYDHHAFLWENGVMTDLGHLPDGNDAEARSINERGQVVGVDDSDFDYPHCFAWSSGRMIDLGSLGDLSVCEAYSLNNKGVVVGWTDSIENGWTPTGFIWRQGLMADLNTLTVPGNPWEIGIAWGVNDLGMIAADGFNGTDGHAVLLVPQRFNP